MGTVASILWFILGCIVVLCLVVQTVVFAYLAAVFEKFLKLVYEDGLLIKDERNHKP